MTFVEGFFRKIEPKRMVKITKSYTNLTPDGGEEKLFGFLRKKFCFSAGNFTIMVENFYIVVHNNILYTCAQGTPQKERSEKWQITRKW